MRLLALTPDRHLLSGRLASEAQGGQAAGDRLQVGFGEAADAVYAEVQALIGQEVPQDRGQPVRVQRAARVLTWQPPSAAPRSMLT